jgi:hypothetical protein
MTTLPTPSSEFEAETPLKPDMKAAALWLAARGFPVFPIYEPVPDGCSCNRVECDKQGKHPRTQHGFKDATTNDAQINEWWSNWPNANIGMPTGEISGLLVVDIDPRNGGTADRAEFVERFGSIPETPEVITGSGGRHIYFRWPSGLTIPKTLAQGIDLQGAGAYVVAPPSLHKSGKRYEVDGLEGGKAFLNIADAPPWLLERIATGRQHMTANRPDNPSKVLAGGRNKSLTSWAGAMRRPGMSQEAIEAALMIENRNRCEPPLPEDEVRRIAVSVSRYEPSDDPSAFGSEEGATLHQSSSGNWPGELRPEAYYGVAGDVVRLIEPHTESDPAAVLIQLLVAFGNLIGRSAHFVAEADRHYTNLFMVLVGQTAKGRKGTSFNRVASLLARLDLSWRTESVHGGLSSGEGLIWAVRDQVSEDDPGVADKRRLVVESEFAKVLQVAERETNTLSAIVREAWDSGNLQTLTKKTPARATDAHISIIGHITKDELKRLLTDTAACNGFANRYLWVCVRRSKLLPEGGGPIDFDPFLERLQAAVNFARTAGELRRDEEARTLWGKVYGDLSEGRRGLLGAVTSRAEAQTMRLACIYALLDCSAIVRAEHLLAALEVWRYCEDSARFIFGDALGDGTADEILRELRHRPEGLTRTEIREHFNRNKSSAVIGVALNVLIEYGLARVERVREDHAQKRPTERWFAVNGVRD